MKRTETPAPKKARKKKALNIPLALGLEARDILTGIEGILIIHSQLLFMGDRWDIQPVATNEKEPESISIDANQIEVLSKVLVMKPIPIAVKSKAGLGDFCKDVVSGYEGTITTIAVYINGCVRVLLKPKFIKGNKFDSGVWVDIDQTKVLKAVKPIAPKKEKTYGDPRNPKDTNIY